MAFLTFDREVEQYLCAAVLRPGKAVASDGAIGLLRRLLPLLRAAFPRVRFLVRLDGGFATPELFDFLDAEPRLDYVVAMAKNAVLVRRAEPAMEVARAQSEVSGEDGARLQSGESIGTTISITGLSRGRTARLPRRAGGGRAGSTAAVLPVASGQMLGSTRRSPSSRRSTRLPWSWGSAK